MTVFSDIHLFISTPPLHTGDNDTILVTVTPATVTSEPAEGTTPLVPTYPLPPGGQCHFHMVRCLNCLTDWRRALDLFSLILIESLFR